jgi:hypothetical protein
MKALARVLEDDDGGTVVDPAHRRANAERARLEALVAASAVSLA